MVAATTLVIVDDLPNFLQRAVRFKTERPGDAAGSFSLAALLILHDECRDDPNDVLLLTTRQPGINKRGKVTHWQARKVNPPSRV